MSVMQYDVEDGDEDDAESYYPEAARSTWADGYDGDEGDEDDESAVDHTPEHRGKTPRMLAGTDPNRVVVDCSRSRHFDWSTYEWPDGGRALVRVGTQITKTVTYPVPIWRCECPCGSTFLRSAATMRGAENRGVSRLWCRRCEARDRAVRASAQKTIDLTSLVWPGEGRCVRQVGVDINGREKGRSSSPIWLCVCGDCGGEFQRTARNVRLSHALGEGLRCAACAARFRWVVRRRREQHERREDDAERSPDSHHSCAGQGAA